MNKLPIVKIISYLVVTVGAMVVVGWIFDIGVLKSVLPNVETMKFTVALSFIASGMILYSIAKEREGDSFILQTITPALVLLILLFMTTSLISLIFKINIGIDNIFIVEKAGAINTVIPGRPSVAAMINLILISVCSMLVFVNSSKQKIFLMIVGSINIITGGVAIIGYLIGVPLLYYYIPNVNTALAIPAALLFILMGVGFILCGNTASKQN